MGTSDQNNLDEAEIVRRACAGDRNAAELLFTEILAPMLVALGRRWNYPDLANELFVRLSENNWRRLRTWKGDASLKGWIRIVARRICLEDVKDQAVSRPLDDRELPCLSGDDSGIRRLVEEETHSGLLKAVEALESPRDRMVLRMFYFESKELSAIALELGIPLNTAYVIKSRAIARLRRNVGELATNADPS